MLSSDLTSWVASELTSLVGVAQAQLLGGTWKLVYTAASELGALLALSRLPFVTVGDITQAIDVATGRVVNKVRRLC